MTLIVDNEWRGQDFLVYARDVREVRISTSGETVCLPGIRAWADKHGVNYQTLRRVGIPASEVVKSGDVRAQVAVLKIYKKLFNPRVRREQRQ